MFIGLCVCFSFLFGFKGEMLDLIVFIPDIAFLFTINKNLDNKVRLRERCSFYYLIE